MTINYLIHKDRFHYAIPVVNFTMIPVVNPLFWFVWFWIGTPTRQVPVLYSKILEKKSDARQVYQ